MNVCSPYMHRVSWNAIGLLNSSTLFFLYTTSFSSHKTEQDHTIFTAFEAKKITLYLVLMDIVQMPKLGTYESSKASNVPSKDSTMKLEMIIWCVKMEGEGNEGDCWRKRRNKKMSENVRQKNEMGKQTKMWYMFRVRKEWDEQDNESEIEIGMVLINNIMY